MLDRDHCRENGSKGRNKRRFSEDQIKSLETIFDAENKLEPRRKMELARELGLQPRQIAIWFQNRRARYKSKLLQREYSVLKANYDSLASSFESLKQEKQTLLKQLQKLGDVMEKPDGSETMEEKRWDGLGSDLNSNDGDSEFKEKVGMKLKVGSDSSEVFCYSDGEDSKNTGGYCEETELLSMAEPKVSDSLTFPPEKLCDLDSRCYFEQSSLQWWELWP